MTNLAIARLSATVHGDGVLAPRVSRMLTRLAERRLDDALRVGDLPPGDWCVRRVDVGIVVDAERPDGAIETQWAAAVVDALRLALSTGSGDVVHYQHHTEALVDLITSLAVGRLERVWAWRRTGLLASDDPRPESAAAGSALAVLRRHPSEVLPVLVRVARGVGVAALHRLFGARGWAEVARLVWRAFDTESPPADRGQAGRTVAATLAAELMGRSTLAGAFGRSRLRPDPATAHAWAVLVAAEADSTVLSRPVVAAALDEVAQVLAGGARPTAAGRDVAVRDERAASLDEPPGRNSLPGSPRLVETGTPPPQDGLEADHRVRPDERVAVAVIPEAPPHRGPANDIADDTQRASRCTVWAGLLFLINTAAAAGVPDAPLDDPALAARTLPWVLHGIARHLVPAAGDDPAVLAFAGLADPPTSAASDIEDRRLAQHAHRWAAATAARLHREDEDPLTVTAELALRRGEITAEPGWVEVLLPLAEVDIDVRRAGLDIDPGWVRWLGTVVRFGYA